MFKKFWQWYERNKTLNIGIAAFLFLIQIVHLVWLSLDPLAFKISGETIWHLEGAWKWIILFVDYTEIPAIIATSLVYINDIRTGTKVTKAWLYFFFINSQWLHIFWITDEFVVASFSGESGIGLPGWLAWIALLIDYLELPVIYDTLKRFFIALSKGKTQEALESLKEE